MIEQLEPRLTLLGEESVLIQAWKKTSSYIRSHNWFSDPLELDQTEVDLQRFLNDVGRQVQGAEHWKTDPLRLVPAPKASSWRVVERDGERIWGPAPHSTASDDPRSEPFAAFPDEQEPESDPTSFLRPLAHVSLRDQVVATAAMMCLANRVETHQGNPEIPPIDNASRSHVISYGHRLFCGSGSAPELRHRWGSKEMYRKFSTDYRSFLDRPKTVADEAMKQGVAEGESVYVVTCDLKRFYDRVSPSLMAQALRTFRLSEEEQPFFDFVATLLNWRWCASDYEEAQLLNGQEGPDSPVVLPQGLASSGFWANIVLLDLDDAFQQIVAEQDLEAVRVLDVCRYVDDFCFVLKTRLEPQDAAETLENWLDAKLRVAAPFLEVNRAKTKIEEYGLPNRGVIRQSDKMNRIQTRVSGGFTALESDDLLDSLEGLILRFDSSPVSEEEPLEHAPRSDVPAATQARFAAGTARKVVRDSRVLLPERSFEDDLLGVLDARRNTRNDLDQRTKALALSLISLWVRDPSHVRVFLTALDLWPAAGLLADILPLLRDRIDREPRSGPEARVAEYCLAELLRVGASRTGFASDPDSLPADLDLPRYRQDLRQAALAVLGSPFPTPWYLSQQALLFLLSFPQPDLDLEALVPNDPHFAHYRELIQVLNGNGGKLSPRSFAVNAVVLYRCYPQRHALRTVERVWTEARIRAIADLDASMAAELLERRERIPAGLKRLSQRLLVHRTHGAADSLARLVADQEFPRDELTLLRFADKLLCKFQKSTVRGGLPPWHVFVSRPAEQRAGSWQFSMVRPQRNRGPRAPSFYTPPSWCMKDPWRFQLGALLRFALTGNLDFTQNVGNPSSDSLPYRPAPASWLRRIHGHFNGQTEFGSHAVPITDWFERFLSALLRWPGRLPDEHSAVIAEGIGETRQRVRRRIAMLERAVEPTTGTLVLQVDVPRDKDVLTRPFTVCVAQSVLPSSEDLHNDPTLSDIELRRKCRNHLRSLLATVRQAWYLRTSHTPPAHLDWLILPELAVHPADVAACLEPFVRLFKTIVLAGVTYRELPGIEGLVNTALWLAPQHTQQNGVQFVRRTQGKQYLAKIESEAANNGLPIRPYRPAQWVLQLRPPGDDPTPLRLTASVCYDAMDLSMTSHLRERSDVYAIPALNQDVKTYDDLSLALHYLMYQTVIVANNGEFGGSSVYWPMTKNYERRVLHLHGSNQATLGFFEIPDVPAYLEARAASPPSEDWKWPPAGYSGNPP